MRRTLSSRPVVFFLVLFIVQSGCATARNAPTPEERASFGTVGVVRASFLPEAEFRVPAKGRADGAIKGAGIAFAGVLEGGIRGASGMSGEAAGAYLVVLFALAAAATPFGAVVGAVKAMPGGEAAAAEARTKEILARMRTQEVLRDEVLRAGAGATAWRLVPVEGVGPASPDNVAGYGSLPEEEIDAVLEVALLRIALESEQWGSDPPLRLAMSARSRVVRAADGSEIDRGEYHPRSQERKLSEWAADNAVLLGRAYEEGYRKIAADIVRRVFPATSPAREN